MKFEIELMPAPREVRSVGKTLPRAFRGAPLFSVEKGGYDKLISDQLTRSGWVLTGEGEIRISSQTVQDEQLLMDPITGYRHGEGYRLTLGEIGGHVTVAIDHVSVRGLKYGLSTLADLMVKDGSFIDFIPELEIVDGPRFPIRALIEGYYGPPWSPGARKSLMELMAEHRMNAYFYGPKDDLFHREKWRDLYEGVGLEELESVIGMTLKHDMDFWYSIGPGLSMSYSSDEDFQALEAKLAQVHGLGVTRFGLLFDDIPEKLQHESDKAAFPDLPHAHATVANRLFDSLKDKDPSIRLAVCPTQYHGNGDEPYITEFGNLLNPRIDMFWTGPEICSRQLTLSDTSLLSRNIDRPVLFWDNYPVNDCEMVRELHIGPYRGRDPHLYRASNGVIANGMEYPESTKIGLLTVAAYLWNPEAYNPEKSWNYALQTVVGSSQWEDFRIFADNNRYSCLYTTDSPDLKDALESMSFLNFQNKRDEVLTVLGETTVTLSRAVSLFDAGLKNRILQDEIQPWIRKFRTGVELIVSGLIYLKNPGDTTRLDLVQAQKVYSADDTYVFADVLNDFSDNILGMKID